MWPVQCCCTAAALRCYLLNAVRLRCALLLQCWELFETPDSPPLSFAKQNNDSHHPPSSPSPPKYQVYRHTGDAESFWGPVWAGVAAGAAASLTRVPTEVVKQRLQTREFAGAVTAVRRERENAAVILLFCFAEGGAGGSRAALTGAVCCLLQLTPPKHAATGQRTPLTRHTRHVTHHTHHTSRTSHIT